MGLRRSVNRYPAQADLGLNTDFNDPNTLNQINAQIGQGAGLNGTDILPRPMKEYYSAPISSDIPIEESPSIANSSPLTNMGSQTPTPTTPMETSSIRTNEAIVRNIEDQQNYRNIASAAGVTSGLLKMSGGIINANSRYNQQVGQNNFNIHMAEIQALQVASDSASQMLKEQTKGKVRGEQGMLSAVAQGQGAHGDIANTAKSNEEVYAAQNMMNMEINASRQIFGIQTHQRVLQSQSNMEGINRDLAISQAIAGGVSDVAFAGAGFNSQSAGDTALKDSNWSIA